MGSGCYPNPSRCRYGQAGIGNLHAMAQIGVRQTRYKHGSRSEHQRPLSVAEGIRRGIPHNPRPHPSPHPSARAFASDSIKAVNRSSSAFACTLTAGKSAGPATLERAKT